MTDQHTYDAVTWPTALAQAPDLADVAFGQHPDLGLVAATASDDPDAITAVTLAHFGFQYRPDLQIHALPPGTLGPDAISAAARVTRLLSGLGLIVTATPEVEQSARSLAHQAAPAPLRRPVPVAHATAPRASAATPRPRPGR
ncbi:hypothetical protein [Streptacidiphilus neutrinimicus]|uniref:hypothetical protein n=1 Tax=Streptacidiphilus neutrinimicus TaxID=105420 RepID=UPI0005A9C076|nr:hypothetical protein [Streptacidiphilus neutrinimicus]